MDLHDAIERAQLRADSKYLRQRWECPEILWNLLHNLGEGSPDMGLDRLLELVAATHRPKEYSYLTRPTGVATRLIDLEQWCPKEEP